MRRAVGIDCFIREGDVVFAISAESILTVTAEERGTARSVTATFSTQDTPEAVRKRLGSPPTASSPAYEEPGKEEAHPVPRPD